MSFSTTRCPRQDVARGRASMRRRNNTRRRLLAILIAGSIALSCVGTTPFRRLPNTSDLEIETWHQLSSPDFVIYSPVSREHVEAFALDLGGDGQTPESERLHASAIALYRRALALQGTNPFALAGLGLSQLATGRFDAARQSLAQAQAHGEWDANLTLNRGRVEQKTGFPIRAREYWIEVIRLGSLEDAEKASVLLAGLDSSR
jgi:tetratricopeptide (TPR) repeat protein